MEVTTVLQQLQHQVERLHLGFVDIRYKTVYCNRRCEGALWYTVEDGQQIPIRQNALRGYADRLEVVSLQRRGKDTDKLQFTLNCGDLHYVLEAGSDSEFAQSLVYSLAVLTLEQLRQPIIIQPEPGEDSAVLFARIRTSDYRRVFVERNKLGDYPAVLEQVIHAVERVGTPPSPAAPSTNRVEPQRSTPRVTAKEADAPVPAPVSSGAERIPDDDAPAASGKHTTSTAATAKLSASPPAAASPGTKANGKSQRSQSSTRKAVQAADHPPESQEPSPPQTTAQPDTPPPDPVTRFQAIATWTGHKPSQLRAIAKAARLPASSADLLPEQQNTMRDVIFVDWAVKYPVWEHTSDCLDAYREVVVSLPQATDARIWEAWKSEITHRLTVQQQRMSA
jgi:hypothetical protein